MKYPGKINCFDQLNFEEIQLGIVHIESADSLLKNKRV